MSLNISHYLEMAAARNPDNTVIIHDDYRLTYAELAAYARRIANVLRAKGVQRGDKVAMMIPNTPYFPIIYFGGLLAGATIVPVNVLLKGHEIHYYLEDSDAKVFFAWVDFLDEAIRAMDEAETCRHLIVVSRPEDMEPPRRGEAFMPLLMGASPDFDITDTMPDDTAVILYTSGTTGHPKGAELTHFNMFFNAYCVAQHVICATEEDTVLSVLPLFHSFGQTCTQNAVIIIGAAMTMVPVFDAAKVLDVVQRDRVTVLSLVPTMFHHLLNQPDVESYDLSSIRITVSGGAALPAEVHRRFEERFGVTILEGYGLSETSPVASFNTLDRPHKIGSIGHPIWGCEMRLMRQDQTFAGVDEVGEIVIRGHNVMKGYYKKPIATEEAMVNGWFHTGDLARVDNEGYFFIVDRCKDVIIRSGMNIYPREVEEVLFAHPAVREAAVVGVPDEVRGEEVKAYVTLRNGDRASASELDAYCQERLAKYKCPKTFEFLPDLPKGPTGKILKRELARQ